MKISSGLVAIQNNKILLVHPTNSPWWKTYSIPKGHIDEGEDLLDTAIRETYEETGILFNNLDIDETSMGCINYIDEYGKIFKKVYFFVHYPKEIITPDMFKPQLDEVDFIGFLSKSEAEKRIFGRFKPILNLLE